MMRPVWRPPWPLCRAGGLAGIRARPGFLDSKVLASTSFKGSLALSITSSLFSPQIRIRVCSISHLSPPRDHNDVANDIMTSKERSKKSLKHGRPPVLQTGRPKAMSAKSTRTLIRSHHQLQRALAKAELGGDADSAAKIKQDLEQQGGLAMYQQASLQGQSRDRGGDTSKLLLQWLQPELKRRKDARVKVKVLEVGALSTKNECSRCERLDVTRIDLNSQEPGITQQDFMQRPIPPPGQDRERFDVISLSLVLNYVPTPGQRGEMLRRTTQFLAEPQSADSSGDGDLYPMLFLVLPAPCVNNSRYLDEQVLSRIMSLVGYTLLQRKCSAKLISYLWAWQGSGSGDPSSKVPKAEVCPGAQRNNFCIVLS